MNILRGFNLLKAIFTFFKFWEFHNKYCIYIFPPLPSPFQFIPVPTFKFMTSSLVSTVPHIYSHVHIYDLLNPLSVAHVSMCLGLISWDWIMREWRKPRVNVCCWCGTAISWTPASDPWEKGKAYARPPRVPLRAVAKPAWGVLAVCADVHLSTCSPTETSPADFLFNRSPASLFSYVQ